MTFKYQVSYSVFTMEIYLQTYDAQQQTSATVITEKMGLAIQGVTTAFKAAKQKAKCWWLKTRKAHICGIYARILLPLEESPSVILPPPSIWNSSVQEAFPLKSKDRGLKIAFTVSFIYQASLALLYLSDFSPRQLQQELLQCAVFSLVLVLVIPYISLWLGLLCCFLWHYSMTGLECRHLERLVVNLYCGQPLGKLQEQ